jgi:hypothetical protein
MTTNLFRFFCSLVFLFLIADCNGRNGANGSNGSQGLSGQQLTSTTGNITGVVENKNTGVGVPSAVVSLLGGLYHNIVHQI